MSGRGRPRTPDILTPREWEVLELLRRGHSNREIAANLGISYDGARYHVSQILSKLQVSTREEAAVWQPANKPWWVGALAPLFKLPPLHLVSKLTTGAAIAGIAAIALGLLVMDSRQDEAQSNLGKVVYLHNGDLWIKALPNGPNQRLTSTGDYSLDPEWSSSGNWILVSRTVPRADGLSLSSQWLIRADGTGLRQIPSWGYWSPSEDKVAYRIDGPEGGSVITESADGSLRSTVASGLQGVPGLFSKVAWSPDGEWLAFVAFDRAPDDDSGRLVPGTLYRVRQNGSDLEAFYRYAPSASHGGLNIYGWSPDGRYFLMSETIRSGGDGEVAPADVRPLLAVSVDGSGLAPGDSPVVLLYEDAVAVTQGGRIAVAAGGEPRLSDDKRIALYSPATGQVTYLTDPGSSSVSPSWSGDETRIAFAASPADIGFESMNERRIWIMDRDGSRQRQLTDDPRYRDEYPLLDPTGTQVVFVRTDLTGEDSSGEIWVLDVASKRARRVVDRMHIPNMGQHPPTSSFAFWTRFYDWWRD